MTTRELRLANQKATTTDYGTVLLSEDGGTTAGEAVQATDARLSDNRDPNAHTHPQADITNLTTDLDAIDDELVDLDALIDALTDALADHLADATAAHAATAVSFTPYSSLGSTTVQAAVQELLDEVTAGIFSGDAIDVDYDPVLTDLIATDVQAAIDELWAILDSLSIDTLPPPTGDLDMNSQGIIDLANPVDPQDAATKAYVDDQLALLPAVLPQVSVINVMLGAVGGALAAGFFGYLRIPWAGDIVAVALLADQAGDVELDLWLDTHANAPPTGADSIVASTPPTLSAAIKAEDTTLTGWATTVGAGDWLGVDIVSAATLEQVTLAITIERTA